MTIDNVVEKATIIFPEAISLIRAENLLEYIAKKLPAEIIYTTSQGKFINSDEKGNVSIRCMEPDIGGILTSKKTRIFDSFKILSNNTYLTNIQFYSEHRPEVRQLWDDVRKAVDDYFAGSLRKKH